MRFEVPQFIEVEDKIFGPLSWRQFLYLGGGIGAAVAMFLMLPFIIFAVLGIPLALLAGALAFYPVNNRPFSFFLEAIVNYATKERLYLWRKKEEIVHKQDRAQTTEMPQLVVRTKKTGDISALARQLELKAIQKQQ
jgi:PrgI family protein